MRAQSDFNVIGLPTTILIDREGNERGRLVGPAEWDDAKAADLVLSASAPVALPLPPHAIDWRHLTQPSRPMAANVTQSIFDVTSAAGAQFLAMIIGAFLASTGGFLVAWLLDRMERKRQERSIALVCLDLLSSLSVLTNCAQGRPRPRQPLRSLTRSALCAVACAISTFMSATANASPTSPTRTCAPKSISAWRA